MIRGLVVLVFLILLGPVAAKAQMPAGAAGYLDKGWREVMRAEGDLDKDGIDDWALILEAPDGETTPHNACREEDAWSQAPVRRLLIGFGGEGAAEAPVVDDATVVLRSDQGGVMGDPLAELRIERGALVIDYFGGSRFRWSETQRFRLQEGAFRLIGHTMSYSDSLSASVFFSRGMCSKVTWPIRATRCRASRYSGTSPSFFTR